MESGHPVAKESGATHKGRSSGWPGRVVEGGEGWRAWWDSSASPPTYCSMTLAQKDFTEATHATSTVIVDTRLVARARTAAGAKVHRPRSPQAANMAATASAPRVGFRQASTTLNPRAASLVASPSPMPLAHT